MADRDDLGSAWKVPPLVLRVIARLLLNPAVVSSVPPLKVNVNVPPEGAPELAPEKVKACTALVEVIVTLGLCALSTSLVLPVC